MNPEGDKIDAENSEYHHKKEEQIGIAFWITVAILVVVAFLAK